MNKLNHVTPLQSLLVVIGAGAFFYGFYTCRSSRPHVDIDRGSYQAAPVSTSTSVAPSKCSSEVVRPLVERNCCQDSFQTGLFDRTSFELCGAKVVGLLECSEEEVGELTGEVRCHNNGKAFPANPCNDLHGLDKASCNRRRDQLITEYVNSQRK